MLYEVITLDHFFRIVNRIATITNRRSFTLVGIVRHLLSGRLAGLWWRPCRPSHTSSRNGSIRLADGRPISSGLRSSSSCTWSLIHFLGLFGDCNERMGWCRGLFMRDVSTFFSIGDRYFALLGYDSPPPQFPIRLQRN